MQDPANPVPPMLAAIIAAKAAEEGGSPAATTPAASTPLDQVLGLEQKVAELEAIINKWTPTIGELVSLGERLSKEGHSVGSIVAEVASRLLGLLSA